MISINILFYLIGLTIIFYASVSKSNHTILDDTAFHLFISGGFIIGISIVGSLFLALTH
jgi:hypothetical protein